MGSSSLRFEAAASAVSAQSPAGTASLDAGLRAPASPSFLLSSLLLASPLLGGLLLLRPART